MNDRDMENIKRLVEWISLNADYGDITELCNELGVDEYWFSMFYDDGIEED